jgi:enamine deaminase RidA (YjgF/YER057c/UK114 family)
VTWFAVPPPQGANARRWPIAQEGKDVPKRQRISGDGIPEHPQPFSAALRIGDMIFTSAFGGQVAETGKSPDDPREQIAQAFTNMRAIVEKGGGRVDDIAKVTVYLKDRNDRDKVNAEWIKMFPDEDDRPVRHTVTTELPGNRVIQMEFVAVVA